MLLTRKPSSSSSADPAAATSALVASLARGTRRAMPTMDRRAFLRRSGLGVGVGLATSQLTLVKKAEAADPAAASSKPVVRRTVCTHCSVGCAIDAVVENGVWIRQEPVFDSPINLGAHCAKGAAVREHGHGDVPPEVADEAGRRQVPAHLVGPGAERGQRQDARAEEAERPRLGVHGRLLEAQQRAVVPAAQVGVACGAATTATTRRASATRPRSRASRTPGATAR